MTAKRSDTYGNMVDVAVGDVFVHRITRRVVVVGHVNELGGICDDCQHEAFHYGTGDIEQPWRYLGSVARAVDFIVAAERGTVEVTNEHAAFILVAW